MAGWESSPWQGSVRFWGTASGAQTGAVATGAHANEPFCKAIIKQAERLGLFMKANPATWISSNSAPARSSANLRLVSHHEM